MSFSYENIGTNTFLTYELQPTHEIDTMSLGMLTNNKIPGFAPTVFTQLDNTKYIRYNVSSKISVAQLFSGPVNKKRLLGVFTGIIDALLSAEDYMLDTDAMLLDLEYIFADVSTCETVLICLPIMNSGRQNPDVSMFFKNIIFNTQYDQTENCDHVAQILNYLNSVKVLSLPDFKDLLKEMSKPKEAPKPVAPQPTAPQPAAPQPTVPQPAAPQPVVTAAPTQPVVSQPVVPQPAVPVQPQVEIPVKKEAPKPVAPQPEKKEDAEQKPMSMFYLMQHYNKENAAKYKAQKNAKKEAEKQEKLDKKNKKNKQDAPAKQAPQPVNAGFAIPGQQPSLNTSFEVPGAPKPVAPQPTAPQPAKAQPVIQPPQPAPVVPQSAVSAGKPLNFGETTVLGGGAIGETTVLGVANMDAPKVNPYLVRTKNNERIPLNKPVFRIGKERSYVDYFIGDNSAISRSHANIINRDGEFFVVDTNSTNHTYVNGVMIQSNVETKLENNARIKFANEEFDFRLY